MSRKFSIKFSCAEDQLPIIVSLLVKEVSNFHVEENDNDDEAVVLVPSRPRARRQGVKRGMDNTPHTGSGLAIMAALKSKNVCTSQELSEAAVKAGYHPSTYSPVLSRLRKLGLVEMVGPSQWSLTDKATERG